MNFGPDMAEEARINQLRGLKLPRQGSISVMSRAGSKTKLVGRHKNKDKKGADQLEVSGCYGNHLQQTLWSAKASKDTSLLCYFIVLHVQQWTF